MKDFRRKAIRLSVEIMHWMESILAIVAVFCVGYGIFIIVISVPDFMSHGVVKFHKTFETVLGDILLLVVGIELALLLVNRKIELLVDLLFFVVARKMLVQVNQMYELVVGVVALAGLFAIRKYLLICEECKESTDDN